MDLLTVISTCNLANDFTLVFAMALTFSQGNPFVVRDTAAVAAAPLYAVQVAPDLVDETPDGAPRTREAAIVELNRLRAAGTATVIGLIPVPPIWALQFQRTPKDLLDPCVNVSIASAMVSQFEYECGAKAERACVLRHYAKEAGIELFDEDVLETIRLQGLPKNGPVEVETSELFGSPVFVPKTPGRDWGADKLFFGATAGRMPEKSAMKHQPTKR
jgi:hypothetical protein